MEWRKYFDEGERAIGSRLESAVQTQGAADALTAAMVTRAGVGRMANEAIGILGLVTTTALHMANLPTAQDMREVRREITQLRIELRELGHRLDDARREDR